MRVPLKLTKMFKNDATIITVFFPQYDVILCRHVLTNLIAAIAVCDNCDKTYLKYV